MKNKVDFLKALALLSQVGIVMVIPIFFGVWFGNKLDQWLGTDILFLVIFTVLGVLVGFRNTYRLIMEQQDRKG